MCGKKFNSFVRILFKQVEATGGQRVVGKKEKVRHAVLKMERAFLL